MGNRDILAKNQEFAQDTGCMSTLGINHVPEGPAAPPPPPPPAPPAPLGIAVLFGTSPDVCDGLAFLFLLTLGNAVLFGRGPSPAAARPPAAAAAAAAELQGRLKTRQSTRQSGAL